MLAKTVFAILFSAGLALQASANDEFLLAYYVEIEQEDAGEFVLQQHGQRLSAEVGVSTPIGRGGRGNFSLSLASLNDTTGVLRLELYDDKPGSRVVKTPVYSLDVEFSREGAKGDVVDSTDDVRVNLSYSIVAK